MMKVYILRATLVGVGAERLKFEADSEGEAIMTASLEVMDRAWGDSVWAKGRIELSGPDGEVIQVMEAK